MKALAVEAEEVTMEGAEQVTIRWLISKHDGAPNFAMRLFELGPDGHSPLHTHEWEHEVYVLEGEGELMFRGEKKPFSAGHFIFVPGGDEHSFINTGAGNLKFLCLVPNA
ncbi:MAG: cupin domain-containing protein [Candidatus Krumholzibacteriota bacterium]|nr:cupin domain-containing protein [Candidatus Krumholzibacteriota bacterium]